MKDLLHKFVSVLRIELEDLEEDIQDLIDICQKRKDSKEITNYVYLENKSLLVSEISGIKELLNSISALDTGNFHSIKEMFQEIDRLIQVRTRECSFPEAVYSLVKRRLDKVVTYIVSSD